MAIVVKGRITADHRLEVDGIIDLPPGEVDVRIEPERILPPVVELTPEEEAAINAEIDQLLRTPPTPKTGAEIAQWLRENPPQGWEQVTDSVEYIAERRRKRRERLSW
jgi:hypothetical protein